MTVSEDWESLSHKSTIQFAVEAIRALLLVNGGAVVALLTFCGSAATSDDGPPLVNLSLIAVSLQWFAWGLAGAVVVAFGSYLAQAFFTHRKNLIGLTFQGVAILIAFGSLAAFVNGVRVAAAGFRSLQ